MLKNEKASTKVAVITGDVISSSTIAVEKRQVLLKSMGEALEKAGKLLVDFKAEIFQGDSFQGYTTDMPHLALRAALQIILHMRSLEFGLRVSIGIGAISFETGSSLTSDGTAFMQSGRSMEILKKKDLLLAIGTGDEALQTEWEIPTATLNFLLERCTPLQAAAVMNMLDNKTQQETADLLKVKQPAIQQRLKAAGWSLIQTIVNHFELQF